MLTGSPFEPKGGISRAVRSGSIIAVTGTAPLGKDGKTVAKGSKSKLCRKPCQCGRARCSGLLSYAYARLRS